MTLLISLIRRTHSIAVILLLFTLAPAVLASAPAPVPVFGPRMNPSPIPHPYLAVQSLVDAQLASPPPEALEAEAFAGHQPQEAPGRGIHQIETEVGSGFTLYPTENSCNDFNRRGQWTNRQTGNWTAWYGAWRPFAVDDGSYYRADNVVFAPERVVGPGYRYAANQAAAKISSMQPYAAGYGSPMLPIRPGSTVTVTVKYLIWDHDTRGRDLDWASMGLKPDAEGDVAEYVNGYVRGQWAQLSHTIRVGQSGHIMILLQAQSPVPQNSNIYFDDVTIQVNNRFLGRCF